MEQAAQTVKKRSRLWLPAAAALGLLLVVLLLLPEKREVDLRPYITVTRTGDTVTAVLDIESLLVEMGLPLPHRSGYHRLLHPEVEALLSLSMSIEFLPEADVVRILVWGEEGLFARGRISLAPDSWEQGVKVLARNSDRATGEQNPASATPWRPETRQEEGYLSSLLDENGQGLNLRAVCQQVHVQRDMVCRELFGNNFVTSKTHVYSILFPEGAPHRNGYRAVYEAGEAAEGISCFFTVDVWDLYYQSGQVGFEGGEAILYDSREEAEDLSEFLLMGCRVEELVGGSLPTAERINFDYNGFIRFIGLPLSHEMPNGRMWSPTADALREEDVWRLTTNGDATMIELVRLARQEIYARYNGAFTGPEAEELTARYLAYGWYSGGVAHPEEAMTQAERDNVALLLLVEDLLAN